MIKNKNWESLVWIIVWVFILSIAIIWIWNLIFFSNDVNEIYENSTKTSILRDNLGSIVKNIDTSNIREKEIFYLYKNTINKEFKVFTWVVNEQYKYIDEFWNKVDNLANFPWDIYARLLWLEKEDTSIKNQNQIIRASIKKLIKDWEWNFVNDNTEIDKIKSFSWDSSNYDYNSIWWDIFEIEDSKESVFYIIK